MKSFISNVITFLAPVLMAVPAYAQLGEHNVIAWLTRLYANTLLQIAAGCLRNMLIVSALACARWRVYFRVSASFCAISRKARPSGRLDRAAGSPSSPHSRML